MSLPSAVRGEERLIPFFTAPSRAQAWFKDDHIVAPERTRDLFARYPGCAVRAQSGLRLRQGVYAG